MDEIFLCIVKGNDKVDFINEKVQFRWMCLLVPKILLLRGHSVVVYTKSVSVKRSIILTPGVYKEREKQSKLAEFETFSYRCLFCDSKVSSFFRSRVSGATLRAILLQLHSRHEDSLKVGNKMHNFVWLLILKQAICDHLVRVPL